MIEIGSTDFLLKVPSLPEDEFELYSSKLFDQWEASLEKYLSLTDYAISLEIEEGSISGRAKIAAVAGAIYMGVANYGGFISGLQIIRSQISYVNNILVETAKQPFNCSRKNVTLRNRGGALSRLQSLFHKVQNGTLTAAEATQLAMEIFGEKAGNIPGLVEDLRREFEKAPKHPEQLSLIEGDNDGCEADIEPSTEKLPRKRDPQPVPVSQQFRIEIWRESKQGIKRVKVTKK
ncbi:hypothetical protein HRH59_03600 [Rheinheimera sp. YQF-2]|uniref:Uncharacterized protein n=1 Tax=Rheinheimera lutimaris TaxID=2740584 RepID=A0A7Y5EGS2_9GAMM|nr:hypothetical protein [Rheinheimera lutimaris]NRQ41654.1 hypothetical protein [Rheinheimera lutimaris]